MKFIVTQGLIFISSVTFLLRLAGYKYFSPWLESGDVNWYNVVTMLLTLFVIMYALGALSSFLLKKKLAYGKSEYPPSFPSIIHGLLFATGFTIFLLLHIFHILSFTWGLAILIVVLIGYIQIR